MKMPSGLVTARISAKKTRICSHPLIVIGFASLEFFGAQKRVRQINEQQGGNPYAQDRFEIHRSTPYRNSSHPRTYASESKKKTIVNPTKIRSNIRLLHNVTP
jgi:hypothetical protein